jgi:hypothetical protein
MVLTVLAACSSPEQKIEQTARAAHSSEVTVRKPAADLQRGHIPRVYAKQIVRAVESSQREQAQQPEWNSVPERTRQSLAKAIVELAALGESPEPYSHEP